MSSGDSVENNIHDRLDMIQKSIGEKWKLYSSENLEEALREMGKILFSESRNGIFV